MTLILDFQVAYCVGEAAPPLVFLSKQGIFLPLGEVASEMIGWGAIQTWALAIIFFRMCAQVTRGGFLLFHYHSEALSPGFI